MEKISSLKALESLKEQIVASTTEIASNRTVPLIPNNQAHHPGDIGVRLVDFGIRSVIKEIKYGVSYANSVFDKNKLPETVEITPQLVRFLADDEKVYAAKKAIVKRSDTRWQTEASIAGSAIILYFTGEPTTAMHLGTSAIHRVQQELNIKAEYTRLLADRDQIARAILENYQVTEPEPGKYILKRGKFIKEVIPAETPSEVLLHVAISSPPRRMVVAPTGFDPKLDLSTIPDLPDIDKSPTF